MTILWCYYDTFSAAPCRFDLEFSIEERGVTDTIDEFKHLSGIST
jgi:hypothetical protein